MNLPLINYVRNATLRVYAVVEKYSTTGRRDEADSFTTLNLNSSQNGSKTWQSDRVLVLSGASCTAAHIVITFVSRSCNRSDHVTSCPDWFVYPPWIKGQSWSSIMNLNICSFAYSDMTVGQNRCVCVCGRGVRLGRAETLHSREKGKTSEKPLGLHSFPAIKKPKATNTQPGAVCWRALGLLYYC